MHIHNLQQLADTYNHVYLSPHLDDVALSCGGAIARHNSAGARVLVVTIGTAIPPAEAQFSRFAADMHRRWQLTPDQAVRQRLQEDLCALEWLGADSYWAGLPDAIYRMPDVYVSDNELFGQPAANDPLRQRLALLLDQLHAAMPQATFYAPMAVGNHVDHQLVYEATLESGWSRSSAFYEDVPYALATGALEQRMAAIRRDFIASVVDIDASLNRKLGAIAAYASQMNELFGGEAAMREQVTAYHEGVRPEVGTYGERLWLMV